MSENGITLDPKHGVNPSIFHCFYCGKEMGVVLFGRLKDGSKAPMDCGVIDMEPCAECAEWMRQGVILISCRDGDEGKDNPHRTGGWIVIKDEAIREIVNEPACSEILAARFAFVPDVVWDALGLPRETQTDTGG
jgi:hypothetical protein